jgi:hypothetical protein
MDNVKDIFLDSNQFQINSYKKSMIIRKWKKRPNNKCTKIGAVEHKGQLVYLLQ